MRKLFLGLAIAMLASGPVDRAAADSASDRQQAQQIAQNMKESGELQDFRVGVKYQKGTAWLMGTVISAEQREAAEQIALRSQGVKKVVNKLEVSRKTAAQEEQFSEEQSFQPASAPMPAPLPQQARRQAKSNMPVPYARTMQGDSVQAAGYGQYPGCAPGAEGFAGAGAGGPMPMPHGQVASPYPGQAVSYDNPQMPGYAWPSYAAYPNYAALTYPQQYSASAWPYIGPFYPYPQVPLGWRKVTLEWDDGWWFLDFKDCKDCH